jgi:MATE family multidrug resistance protein
MLLFRGPFSTVYIDNPFVSPLIYDLLLIAILFQLFDGIQAVAQGVLRGAQDVKVPAMIAFVAYWIIGIPSAWFLSEYLEWGLIGIWLALTLGLAFGALALSFRFYTRLVQIKSI